MPARVKHVNIEQVIINKKRQSLSVFLTEDEMSSISLEMINGRVSLSGPLHILEKIKNHEGLS